MIAAPFLSLVDWTDNSAYNSFPPPSPPPQAFYLLDFSIAGRSTNFRPKRNNKPFLFPLESEPIRAPSPRFLHFNGKINFEASLAFFTWLSAPFSSQRVLLSGRKFFNSRESRHRVFESMLESNVLSSMENRTGSLYFTILFRDI